MCITCIPESVLPLEHLKRGLSSRSDCIFASLESTKCCHRHWPTSFFSAVSHQVEGAFNRRPRVMLAESNKEMV